MASAIAAGGNQPPAGEITSPLKPDSTNVADGARIFGSMNCDGCHGGGALGWVGPSLVDGRWRYGGEDGAIYQSIFYGRPRGMPAYGGILSTEAIWKIVTYKLKALVSCALSTRRGTSAWRAGLSKAVAAPATKARP